MVAIQLQGLRLPLDVTGAEAKVALGAEVEAALRLEVERCLLVEVPTPGHDLKPYIKIIFQNRLLQRTQISHLDLIQVHRAQLARVEDQRVLSSPTKTLQILPDPNIGINVFDAQPELVEDLP